jgi:hypothetical protein
MSGERSTLAMLMDNIPKCPCSWYDVIHLVHLHLVVGVTVTCARTDTSVPQIYDRLPISRSFTLEGQRGKLDANLRTPRYPFAPEDGGRLAPMAAELIDRFAILVAIRRFPSIGAADARLLRSNSYVRRQHYVRRSTCVPFRRFWGGVRREFMLRLSDPLHGNLGSHLRDALHEGNADALACLRIARA